MAVICRARWRENRTIFNTPNPRLMNVSLLRDSKLLHGQERRGSRMSVRAPSRQPSMASLRPHSPNPSLGKTGLYSMPPSRWSAPPPISLVSGLPRLHFWFFFYHFNLPFLCCVIPLVFVSTTCRTFFYSQTTYEQNRMETP